MSRRRFTLVTLALVATLSLVAGGAAMCIMGGDEPSPRIVLVAADSGPFWQRAADGARRAAAERAVELRVVMPDAEANVEQQSDALRALGADAPYDILIGPAAPAVQGAAIDELASRRRVITIDSDAGEKRACHVGLCDFRTGRLCGELVCEAMPQGGKVAVLVGELEDSRVAAQLEGLRQETKNDCEVVECFSDGGDEATRGENVRRALAAHPDLACVVDLTSRPATAVVQALDGAGRLDAVTVVTTDESAETLEEILAGRVHATVARDPYQLGYQAVCRMSDYNRWSPLGLPAPGRGMIFVPGIVVRRDNVAPFLARVRPAAELPGG